MPRISGYKVTVTGFLPVEKGSLDSAIETAQALKTAKESGDISKLTDLLQHVTVTEKMGSMSVDASGASDGEGEGEASEETEQAATTGRRRRR